MCAWDERKSASNALKHGVPLDLARALFGGPVVEWEDTATHDEDRWISMGRVSGRVLVCVWTWRGDRRRVISLRRATRSEAREYYEAIG